MGQFTAAVAAGALAFSDGLQLVLERGRLMGEYTGKRPGGMATVLGLKDGEVSDVVREAAPDGSVGVGVFNGPGHTVISGDVGALERAMALARERGGRVLRLPISVPGHMPLMEDAARQLSKSINALPFRDPEPPLVSNISAKLLTRAEEVRQELADQICKAVQWARCVRAMSDEGTGTFVEVGPGQVLSKLVRRITGDAQVLDAEHITTEELLALADVSPAPVRSSVPVEAAG
jgi:[acyl-carrier-protein] S-malonyltransferase